MVRALEKGCLCYNFLVIKHFKFALIFSLLYAACVGLGYFFNIQIMLFVTFPFFLFVLLAGLGGGQTALVLAILASILAVYIFGLLLGFVYYKLPKNSQRLALILGLVVIYVFAFTFGFIRLD